MEMPLMHHKPMWKMHSKDIARAFDDISMPSALFGVIVSTMFGMTVGMMMGKRNALKTSKYLSKSQAKMGKEKWMGKEMAHHHHGTGSPMCTMKHDGEQHMAEEDPRNEGE